MAASLSDSVISHALMCCACCACREGSDRSEGSDRIEGREAPRVGAGGSAEAS